MKKTIKIFSILVLMLTIVINQLFFSTVSFSKDNYYTQYKKYFLSSKKRKELAVYKYIYDKIKKKKISSKNKPVSFNSSVKEFKKVFKKKKTKYVQVSNYISMSVFNDSERLKYGVPAVLIAAIHFRENENDFKSGKFLADLEDGKERNNSFKDFKKNAASVFLTQKSRIINCKLKTGSKDIIAMCAVALYHNGRYGIKNEDNNEWKSWKHSAYIFSGTSLYKKGKYTHDEGYDESFVDKQVGIFRTLTSVV